MPGAAAQVDFGAGQMLLHSDGRVRRTWAFVMTPARNRHHQYVKFVWDRTVATWLGSIGELRVVCRRAATISSCR